MNRILLIIFILSSLNLRAQTQPRLVLPVGHTSSINRAVFSHDGKLALTVSDDNTGRIWNVSLNRELYLINHENIEQSFFYNEDKNFVSYGGGKIVFWETINGQKIDSLNGDKIMFLSKDKFLIFEDDRTSIRDLKTNKIIYQFKGQCIDVSSDLSKILIPKENDTLTNVYDLNSGVKLFDFYNTPHYADYGADEIQKFSSNGHYIINIKEGNNDVEIINSTTGQVFFSVKNQNDSLIIADAQISTDGKFLSLCYYSDIDQNQNYVEVYNFKDKVTTFKIHNIDAFWLKFSLCSKYLISENWEGGNNHVYDLQTEKELLFGNRSSSDIQFIQNSKFISLKVYDDNGSSANLIYDLANPKNCYRLSLDDIIYLNDGSYFIQNNRNRPSLQSFFDSKGNLMADVSKAGLGISLGFQNDSLIIKDIFKGGSVFRDSLMCINEIILAIKNEKGDFIDTKGQQLSNIISMLKGSQGSFVTLRIQGVNKNIREISVCRDITYLQPNVLVNFSQYSEWINDLEMKPDSKNSGEILVACSSRKVRHLDFKSGKQLAEYIGGKDVVSVNSNLKGDRFITSSTDGYARIYDYNKSNTSKQLDFHGFISLADFKENDNYIEVHSMNSVTWTDLIDYKIKHSTAPEFGKEDGRYWISNIGNSIIDKKGKIKYLEASSYHETKIQVKSVSILDKKIDSTIINLGRFKDFNYESHYFISKDSLLIECSRGDSTYVILYNFNTRELQINIGTNQLEPRFLERGIQFNDDEYIKLIQLKNKARMTHNNNEIRDMELLFDKKFLVTTGMDHKTILWDVATGKQLYTRLQLENNDWLVYDEHYRFDGTEGAIDYLYLTCGLEVIDLAQIKDSLYIPNLVQRIMNGENLDHLPKLSDLNICGVTPVVEPLENDKSGNQGYRIIPRSGGVGDVDVYINGIVRLSTNAQKLKRIDANYMLYVEKKLLELYLIPGEELKVKVIAKTANNSISSRGVVIDIETEVKTTFKKPSLHAIMIGVDEYKGEGLDLNYAAKDANDLQTVLQKSAQKFFNIDDTSRVHFYNLTVNRSGANGNEKIKGITPDRTNIINTIAEIEKTSKPEDILVLFFAGHGEIVDKDQLLLLTSESSREDFKGLRMRELLELLNKVPAGKRVLILDACHSGAAINNLDMAQLTGKRDVKDAERQSQRLKELDKLASKSGFAIITASSSDQKALELPQYEHGLMTYALLNAMLNNKSSLDENNQLQLDKWLMATEEEVRKLNVNQSAERMVPINFTLGKVDDEVRSSIVLKEIPLVYIKNVINTDLAYDNLEIETKLNEYFSNRARGGDKSLLLASVEQTNATLVNILYTKEKNIMNLKITILKNNQVHKQFTKTGTETQLNDLIKEIAMEIEVGVK